MEKTMQSKINNYNRQLQIIDFQLSQIIDYGIVMFGQPSSGKTAVSHLLSGNVLKGVKINGKVNVQLATSKNSKAIIKNEPSSYTPLPNILSIDHYNKQKNKICIIDTPGFRNDHGGFMLLATGYCYYRLFEKVQHMKFILCFDINQFWHPDQLFIDTILQFTSHFKNYEEQKHQIWKSCVFIINKVDARLLSFVDLKRKLKQIFYVKIQKKPQEIKLIKQFICYIVDNDRLFTIRKFKENESDTKGDLIKEIDKKTSWFSRHIDGQKQEKYLCQQKEIDCQKQETVQMSQIQMSISKILSIGLKDNKISKQEIIQLNKYYYQRIHEICYQFNYKIKNCCSLDSIINQLVKDTMSLSDSHNFLNLMKRYVDKYYHVYDMSYKKERQRFQQCMFKNFDSEKYFIDQFQKTVTKRKKNYIVKKFHSLKHIQLIKKQCRRCIQKVQVQEQTKWFQKGIKINNQLLNAIKGIIKQLGKLSYKLKDGQQIVYKYGYMLYRAISQRNIFHKMFNNYQGEIKQQLLSVGGPLIITLNSLLRFYFDRDYFSNGPRQLTYKQIRNSYIKNINLKGEEYRYINIDWSFVDFISQYQSDFSQKLWEFPDDPQIVEKIIRMILEFSQQYLYQTQHKKPIISETTKLIQRLTCTRVNCNQLYQLSEGQDRKDQLLFLIRKITNNIGKLLLRIKRYGLARKVYDSILFVDTVCNIYKQSIQQLSNPKQYVQQRTQKLFRLKMEYFNYVESHFHQKEGVIILQQCFEEAQNMNQLKEVVHFLNEQLINQSKCKQGEYYEYDKKLFGNNLFQQFDDDLIDELENLNTLPSKESIQY